MLFGAQLKQKPWPLLHWLICCALQFPVLIIYLGAWDSSLLPFEGSEVFILSLIQQDFKGGGAISMLDTL